MRLSGDREVSSRYARIGISFKTRKDPCVDLEIRNWDKDRPNHEKARPFRSVTRCPQGVWAPGSFNQTLDQTRDAGICARKPLIATRIYRKEAI